MRRTVIVAVSALLALSACDTTSEPSAPPTSEDALTTATAEPPAPVEDAEVTTEPEPTSEEPTEEAAPEMPAEATEFTEEGAGAFALHYVDVVNYTGIHPETGLLEPLSTDGCKSCQNHEDTVVYSVEHGEVLADDIWTASEPSVPVFSEESTVVRLDVKEHEVPISDASGTEIDRTSSGNYTLIFDLAWTDEWLVREIQVEK